MSHYLAHLRRLFSAVAEEDYANLAIWELIQALSPLFELLVRVRLAIGGRPGVRVDPNAVLRAAQLRILGEFPNHATTDELDLIGWATRIIEEESASAVGPEASSGPSAPSVTESRVDENTLAQALSRIVGRGRRQELVKGLLGDGGGFGRAAEGARTTRAAAQIVFLRTLIEMNALFVGDVPRRPAGEPGEVLGDALDLELAKLDEAPAGTAERTLAAMLAAALQVFKDGLIDPLHELRAAWAKVDGQPDAPIEAALVFVHTASRLWDHSRNFRDTPATPEARGSISMVGKSVRDDGRDATALLAWGRYLATLAKLAPRLRHRPGFEGLGRELDAFEALGQAGGDIPARPRIDLFATIVFVTAAEGLAIIRGLVPGLESERGGVALIVAFPRLVDRPPPNHFYELLHEGRERAFGLLSDKILEMVARWRDDGRGTDEIRNRITTVENPLSNADILAMYRRIRGVWASYCLGVDDR